MPQHTFDTKVQVIKYKTLREVAKLAWKDELLEHVLDIPMRIVPGNTPTMRCCVYKERAILAERVKVAMGGHTSDENVIQVIDIACEDCPMGGYEVTNACQGCMAHRCVEACNFGAIYVDENHVSHIDKSKCKECGQCAKSCPYGAIIHRTRPCQNACKVKAISMKGNGAALIDDSKCISCGACVYQCPFGAITDKSCILKVISFIKNSNNNENYKNIAVVAPSIASQFPFAKVGQVVSGIKALGFAEVVEAALGADIVTASETEELLEKGFLTSSCCPAFVSFIEKHHPALKEFISHNPSPMVATAKLMKEKYPDAKVTFIGPCTAKKMEVKKENVKDLVDAVITFEELQALFVSKDIDIKELEETTMEDASPFGRGFARTGGLSGAIEEYIKEKGITDFEFKGIKADGIEECNINLLKKSRNLLDANFIEGMACAGGCINGAGCLSHAIKNKAGVDNHMKQAVNKTILGVIEGIK